MDTFKFYELDLYNITNQFGYFKLLMFYNKQIIRDLVSSTFVFCLFNLNHTSELITYNVVFLERK